MFTIFFTSFMVYAEDLVRKSCPNDDCGTIIIGGAHIIPDAVKWNGTSPIGITLHSSSEGFGFIGKTSFRKDGVNSWSLIMPYEVRATALSSQGPAMGFYFSPYFIGDTSTTITYETSALANADATKTVSGKAILDDATNSAITLKANIKQNYTVKPCQDKSNCQEVEVPSNQMVTFQIVPVVDDSRVSQLGGAKLSYAQISLDITENKQNCPPYPPSFRDSATANYDPNNYFDMIWGLDFMYPVGFQQQCDRKRSFLASANKPFEFSATVIGTTLTGSYAQYLFYIAGHYDENDLSKYASSYQIFRLRSGDFTTTQPTTTNQPPTASFIITKSGTVVDSVKVGETVTLDASQSSDPEKGNLTYQWSSNPAINIPPVQKPSVSFTAKDNYKISLAVADDKGATSTTLSQYISISDNTTPSATFTLTTNVNPTSSGTISRNLTGQIAKDVPVTLTATPNSGFEFDFWSKNCNGTEITQNPLTITITKNTECTANFKVAEQTQPVSGLKACFEIRNDPNDSKQKTLDASCTEPKTDNVTYNWIIYHLNSESFSTSMPVGKMTNPTLEDGKHTVVLIASIGEELSVFSKSVIIASTPIKDFDNELKINATTSATKVSLNNQGSSIPSEVVETVSNHPVKYIWFSRLAGKKLGEGAELRDITLENTGKDVITLVAYNDADYIKSLSQVVTLQPASKPFAEISSIFPKPKEQSEIQSSVLDGQSLIFELDGSTSKDPDNTPDPTKGIKQYKWKWEVSSNSGDLPADKSSSESPPFSIKDVFLGESQQFKFTLKVVDDEDQESDSGVSRIIAIKKPSAKFTAPRLVEVGKEFILNATEPTPSEYKLDGTILSTDSNLNYRWIITDNQGTDVSSSVLQDNSVPTRPKMKITSEGVYTLTLAVVDNYGLYQKTQPVKLIVENSAELVSLDKGTLTKITSTGTPTGVDDGVVSFESGISIKDNQQYGNFLLNQKVAVGTEFKLRARISSNSLDKQVVDLLLVVGIEPVAPFDGGIDTVYHSYDDTGNLVLGSDKKPLVHNLYGKDPKIDWIPQLTTVPFANKVILTSAGLNLGLDGKFVLSGKYYFFIGYVQSDGTIVYSKSPIEVMVE